MWPREVTLVEVGPRDGLQNESSTVPTLVKVRTLELPVAFTRFLRTVRISTAALVTDRMEVQLCGLATRALF